MLEGKVLVTGGAGFLARGLYRRAKREGWPAEFTALSRDDAKHVALAAKYPEVRTIRWDVAGDLDYLVAAFAGHDIVIHAAAAKYVDRSEAAAWDTVRVNVHGSQHVAMAAARAGVHQCIAISTDKAVEAVNVYGMSKAVMERLFLEAHGWEGCATAFSVVRYGNVVASTGSVIAKFRQMAKAGQALTVTDPSHSRYWMSVDEAVNVILEGLKAPGLLTLYEPRAMRMGDLAAAIQPNHRPVIIGERPGEKRNETMLGEQESSRVVALDGARGGIRGGPFYRIAPAHERGTRTRETLTSDKPTAWLTREELLAMAEDAEGV